MNFVIPVELSGSEAMGVSENFRHHPSTKIDGWSTCSQKAYLRGIHNFQTHAYVCIYVYIYIYTYIYIYI